MARRLIAEAGSLNGAVTKSSGLTGEQAARLAASLELARRILREQLARGTVLSSPQAVRDYLRLKLQDRPHEVFVGVFLDAQNRVLAVEELFRGTLTQTSVYPREVVKRALAHNAAALIFAHNHPSGVAEPSRADEALTQALKQALALVDVRVLDHFVIGAGSAMSFAERGLL
jgi:DNA repair protein RadC